jgi:uncharacterized membrane protein (UPF0136 family)
MLSLVIKSDVISFVDFELTKQGYLLKQNKDYGAELALANSVVLLGAGASRTIKTKAKAPVPIGLATAGLLASLYYAKKVKEFRYGV